MIPRNEDFFDKDAKSLRIAFAFLALAAIAMAAAVVIGWVAGGAL